MAAVWDLCGNPSSVHAEGRQARSRDTYVLIRCSEARADGSDYLAIHHHRDSTLHFDEAARRDGGLATVVDRILQVLSWLLEERR